MKVKDAMLLDKDDTIMKLKKDMALLKKDLEKCITLKGLK